ncbi:MAG TPA: glycosyltransferase [Gemmatimonadaceae bacterium]|nr:glycosyltransferase [Gemmatimonadaceae bacterium]
MSTVNHKSARPQILLAQRGDIELYPPVLHQAGILRELGDVTIVDAGPRGSTLATHPDVNRIRVTEGGRLGSSVARVLKLFQFRKTVRRQIERGYDIVIAFDAEAAAAVLEVAPEYPDCKVVVHLHEDLDLASWSGSRSTMWAIRKMLVNIDRATLVVAADSHRAERVRAAVGGRVEVITVMNCPRLLTTIPESRLLLLIRQRGIEGAPIVHYQGAVGPDHGLEVIIKSMPRWPANAILCVVGRGSESYVAGLTALAAECGVARRLVFLGKVPYDQIMSLASAATIGITILDTTRDNWKYAAGASNKRFEYAALGIPQVTNRGPGIDELFVDTGIALTADHTSAESVGRKVLYYLEHPEARSVAGARARQLHLSAYNYENEFAPVLRRLNLG